MTSALCTKTLAETDVDEVARWLARLDTRHNASAQRAPSDKNNAIAASGARHELSVNHPSLETLRGGQRPAWLDDANARVLTQQRELQDRFRAHAHANDRIVPTAPNRKTYLRYTGVDSPANTLGIIRGGSLDKLITLCNAMHECIAFTWNGHEGRLKAAVKPRQDWLGVPATQGLYIADNVNVCEADVGKCDRNALCNTTDNLAERLCTCNPGFIPAGKECIATVPLDKVATLADPFLQWDMMEALGQSDAHSNPTTTAPYVMFSRVDSMGSDMAMVNAAAGESELARIATFKAACDQLPGCVGFNTAGVLKSALMERPKWTRASSVDLWVRDINYCTIPPQGCKKNMTCVRRAPALYVCMRINAPLLPAPLASIRRLPLLEPRTVVRDGRLSASPMKSARPSSEVTSPSSNNTLVAAPPPRVTTMLARPAPSGAAQPGSPMSQNSNSSVVP